MKKLLRVLVVAALLVAIAIPCLASDTTTPTTNPSPVPCTHDYVRVTTKKATCNEAGESVEKCTKCGAEKPGSWQAIDKLTTHGDLYISDEQKATCTQEGFKEYTCNVCKQPVKTETLPKDPSNHPKDSVVDKKIDKAGKNCQTKGYTATKYCNACKKPVDPVYGEVGPHNWVFVADDNQASCTREGKSGWQCSVCHEWKDVTIIPKKAHTKGEYRLVSKATCTKPAVYDYWCRVCKEYMGQFEEGKKAAHTSGKGYVKTPATCTTKGVKAWDCTVCGAEAFYTEEIPALNHKNTEIVNVKPTCTEDGAIIKKCKDCGKELEKSVVPAIGHKWSEYTKPAKDCIPGEKGLKCLNCGETKDVTVVKATKDHVAGDWKVTKAPTCTEKGEEAKSCTVCSKVLETREVAAKGHTAGEYTQTKAPTCTEKGEEVSKCTVCNAVVDTREVAAKGHTAGEWITVRQPSASQNGKMIQKCTVCGAQIGKKYIRANGSADTAVKTVAYVAGAEVANYAKIDLTVDATTELDLVSANGTKVGKLVVEVKEGKVTVKYELSAVPADAFLTFVTEAPAKDIHAQKEFEFEKAISVADELAGAAAAYIYVEIEY